MKRNLQKDVNDYPHCHNCGKTAPGRWRSLGGPDFLECHSCGHIKDRRGVYYGDTVHLPRKTTEDYQTTAKAVARRLKHKKEVEQGNA